MDAQHWNKIESLFHRMVDLPTSKRAAQLQEECGDDDKLRQRVEQLFEDDAVASEFMDEREFLPQQRLDGAEPTENDPRLNQRVGAYRLVSRIARGGMGVVYHAARSDGLFDNDVAVKLIRADAATPEGLLRFERERRTLASLEHPNIARLFDGGATQDGVPYLVMELVRGVPIDEYVDGERLSIRDRLKLFVTVFSAVQFAHQNLVIHRDLKPGNILIDSRGTPKLLDFGIAHLIDDGDEERGGETSGLMLTPEYASPEQLRGDVLTTATDVYSLGLVLFRLLTGKRPPKRGPDVAECAKTTTSEREPTRPSSMVIREVGPGSDPPTDEAREHAARRGTTPRRLRRELSGDLDRIVLKALMNEPSRRYPSAREFSADIERFLAHRPVEARNGGPIYRVMKFVRRNRIAVAAAAVILVVHSIGYMSTWRAEHRAAYEAEHARIEADSFRQISDFLMNTFLASTSYAAEQERAQRNIQQQAEQVRRQYPNEPHLRANLLDALGQVSLRMDLLGDAEDLVREAMTTRTEEFGVHSLELALSLGSLGNLYHHRGEYELAVSSLDAALQLQRTCPPDVHTDVASASNDLAVALRNSGHTEEAKRLHEEALSMRRTSLGDDALPVAESLNNLAAISLYAGEYEETATLLRDALAIRSRILSPAHPLSLQTLANLAVTTYHLGDADICRQLLTEAIEGYRALKAEGEEGLAQVLAHFATLALQSSELDDADAALREALAIQTRRLGPVHPELASLTSNLAISQHTRGQDEEARETWREALRIRRTALSDDHPTMGHAHNDYGAFLVDIGEYCEAKPILLRALANHESNLSADHPSIAAASMNLGVCLWELGEKTEAIEALRRAVVLFERAHGAESTQYTRANQILMNLAAPGGEETRGDPDSGERG